MRERFAVSEAYRLAHRKAQASISPLAAMAAASVAQPSQATEIAASAATQLEGQGQRLQQEQDARHSAEAVARGLAASLKQSGEQQRVAQSVQEEQTRLAQMALAEVN